MGILQKGGYRKSVDYIGRVLTKHPNSPVVNYHMGMALYKSGKRDGAKKFLKKALDSKEDFTGREAARNTLKTL